MVETKELFNRLKRELDNQRKEREQEEEEEMTIIDGNETSSTSSSVETSSHINKPMRHPPATGTKKPRCSSITESLFVIESSPLSPLSLSLYSSMNIPIACLNEHDGCDEAELLARAKRCEEILKLSQQAKEDEAARIKAANIKPLVWANPTFELDSNFTTSDTTDEAASDDVEAKALSQ